MVRALYLVVLALVPRSNREGLIVFHRSRLSFPDSSMPRVYLFSSVSSRCALGTTGLLGDLLPHLPPSRKTTRIIPLECGDEE